MNNKKDMTNISFRVDKKLKEEADELFKSLGMNTSVAINMYLTQCVAEQSIPFVPSRRIPNNRLNQALKEAEEIENHPEKYKKYHNVDKMFEDILNENDAN